MNNRPPPATFNFDKTIGHGNNDQTTSLRVASYLVGLAVDQVG